MRVWAALKRALAGRRRRLGARRSNRHHAMPQAALHAASARPAAQPRLLAAYAMQAGMKPTNTPISAPDTNAPVIVGPAVSRRTNRFGTVSAMTKGEVAMKQNSTSEPRMPAKSMEATLHGLPVPTKVLARRRREASALSKWCLPDIEQGADKFRLIRDGGAIRQHLRPDLRGEGNPGRAKGDQGQPVEMSDEMTRV